MPDVCLENEWEELQFYTTLGNPKILSAIAMAMRIYGTLRVLVGRKVEALLTQRKL